jgi:ATP-binding cassette subfamily B protein
MSNFTFYKQPDIKDCSPTCLKIIAKDYGKIIKIQQLRQNSETTREGSNLLKISEAAEKIGFHTLGVKLNAKNLKEASLPCILHWNKYHYVVLYKIKKGIYYISDPAIGLIKYNPVTHIPQLIPYFFLTSSSPFWQSITLNFL